MSDETEIEVSYNVVDPLRKYEALSLEEVKTLQSYGVKDNKIYLNAEAYEVATFDELQTMLTLARKATCEESITIKLTQNLEASDTIRFQEFEKDTTLILDLNGKTIRPTNDLASIRKNLFQIWSNNTAVEDVVEFKNNITIKNGTIETKTTDGTEQAYSAITIYGTANLNLTIEDVIANGEEYAIATNNSQIYKDAKIYIKNCTFTGSGDLSSGAFLAAGHDLIAEDSTFEGKTGIHIKSGDVTLKNCTVVGTGEKAELLYNGSGYTATGDAITVETCEGYTKELKVMINGGTYTSTNGYTLQEAYSEKVEGESEPHYATIYYQNVNLGELAGDEYKNGTYKTENNCVFKYNEQLDFFGLLGLCKAEDFTTYIKTKSEMKLQTAIVDETKFNEVISILNENFEFEYDGWSFGEWGDGSWYQSNEDKYFYSCNYNLSDGGYLEVFASRPNGSENITIHRICYNAEREVFTLTTPQTLNATVAFDKFRETQKMALNMSYNGMSMIQYETSTYQCMQMKMGENEQTMIIDITAQTITYIMASSEGTQIVTKTFEENDAWIAEINAKNLEANPEYNAYISCTMDMFSQNSLVGEVMAGFVKYDENTGSNDLWTNQDFKDNYYGTGTTIIDGEEKQIEVYQSESLDENVEVVAKGEAIYYNAGSVGFVLTTFDFTPYAVPTVDNETVFAMDDDTAKAFLGSMLS